MMQHKILIIEDETDINRLLAKILTADGYLTIQAYSGTEGLLLTEREAPDLILLDLMLPGLSGEAFLQKLRRERHSPVPVLILSAKASLTDKVSLLRLGADDYITKPFEPDEVSARVQAALRRSAPAGNLSSGSGGTLPAGDTSLSQTPCLHYKAIKIYPESRIATVNDRELSLTAHEYELLLLFLRAPGKVYSRESLYELVWRNGYYGENNTVNVHVSNLRRKIRDADPTSEYIRTVYGIGFQLK